MPYRNSAKIGSYNLTAGVAMTATNETRKAVKRTRGAGAQTAKRVPHVVPPEDRDFYLTLGPYARRVFVAALKVGPIPTR
jgi:hypothetical protein